jgi:hypothetical protein
LLLLIFPVLTCKNFTPDNYGYDPDEIIYTDVTYSPDGKSVTIYLDGTTVPMTNRQARGLSRELAIQGHDYFEVAFLYNADGTALPSANDIIARASWELMKDAHVSGVYGKGKGDAQNISYQAVVRPSAIGGAAILFVGKKTDKTLLGVGRLSHVDGISGVYTINSGTKSVTFAVDALISGVVGSRLTLPTSSFMTSFGDTVSPQRNVINETNTRATGQGLEEDFHLGEIGVGFPLFKLREDGYLTHAKYEFFTASGANLNTFGIIQAGLGNYEKRQPRYPTRDGRFQYFSVILDNATQIDAVNNLVGNVGSTFQNPLLVAFNPAATEKGSMCAFVFEVPVCPLSTESDPGIWYMRPSYDSYWWDLDDGRGAGGAVLIGYGDVKSLDGYKIRVRVPPDKYLYPNSNRTFDITGLLVELQNASDNSHVEWINNADLTFKISNPIAPGVSISTLVYGIVYVEVIYAFNGKIHTDFFVIVVDNQAGTYAAPIPASHYFVVDDYITNVVDIQSRLFDRFASMPKEGSNTFVIIANRDFDLYGLELQREPFVIIVVAGKAGADNYGEPNGAPYDATLNHKDGIGHRVIGRANQSGAYADLPRYQGAFRVYSRTSTAFYFGMWPFNIPLRTYDGRESGNSNTPSSLDDTHLRTYSYTESITVQAGQAGHLVNTPYTVHKSYPYIINAAGPYQDVLDTVPAYTEEPVARDLTGPVISNDGNSGHKFFIWGAFGGTVYNVQVGNDIKVKNRKWFY